MDLWPQVRSPLLGGEMDEAFNPYYTFLGLDEEVTAPNYFQLLRLKESESDPARIAAAADKAAVRVRACRPGEHMAVWLKLLDEIKAARECLSDASSREPYLDRIHPADSASLTSSA